MSDALHALARPAAAFVALIGAAALIGQYTVTRATADVAGVTDALWLMAGYFTVLVNLFVVLHFARLAVGRDGAGRTTAGLVLSITVVGIVYHTLLSGLWTLQGLAWWADQGLHTAMPVLTLGWWLVFAPKAGLSLHHLPGWLILPMAYCAYAVARGAMTGFWAYPFLDPGLHGAGGVAANIVLMAVAFAVLGLVLLAVARPSRA